MSLQMCCNMLVTLSLTGGLSSHFMIWIVPYVTVCMAWCADTRQQFALMCSRMVIWMLAAVSYIVEHLTPETNATIHTQHAHNACTRERMSRDTHCRARSLYLHVPRNVVVLCQAVTIPNPHFSSLSRAAGAV